jgi:hypothetical protein
MKNETDDEICTIRQTFLDVLIDSHYILTQHNLEQSVSKVTSLGWMTGSVLG